MSDLRTAAQQALEALEDVDGPITALLGSLLGSPDADAPGAKVRTAITALRDALAQQKDPTDPGNDVDVLREHVRHLERQVRQLHAQQAEPLNLSDPAVQKRLATQWGYVPAAQAEAAEPVAWNWMLDGLPYGRACYGDPPDADLAERAATAGRTVRLLYTAPPPPQRKPLTEEEIESCRQKGYAHAGLGAPFDFGKAARAVEKASWEKNHGQA